MCLAEFFTREIFQFRDVRSVNYRLPVRRSFCFFFFYLFFIRSVKTSIGHPPAGTAIERVIYGVPQVGTRTRSDFIYPTVLHRIRQFRPTWPIRRKLAHQCRRARPFGKVVPWEKDALSRCYCCSLLLSLERGRRGRGAGDGGVGTRRRKKNRKPISLSEPRRTPE